MRLKEVVLQASWFRKCMGWLMLLLGWLVVLIPDLSAQPLSRDQFRNEIQNAYNSLTFSGVDLPVNGVRLRDISFGYAFASFEKNSGQRWLYLNERRLYDRYQLKLDSIQKFTPVAETQDKIKRLRETTLDEVRGLIAHEWAHHFMGHTFGGITRTNERNADVMAGRILYEYYSENTNTTDMVPLDRSLAVIKLYNTNRKGTYHLPYTARSVLIQKGFTIAWLLRWVQSQPLSNALLGKIEGLELDRKKDELQFNYKMMRDSLDREIVSLSLTIGSLFKSLDSTRYTLQVAGCHSTVVPADSLSGPLLINEAKILDAIRRADSMYCANKDLLADLDRNFPVQSRQVLDSIKRQPSLTEDQYEPLYNFLYINDHRKVRKEFDDDIHEKIIKAFESQDNEQKLCTSALYFCLKGDVRFMLRLSEGSVGINEAGMNRAGKVTTTTQGDLELGFRYTFKYDGIVYFIDKNFNLWSETIGAPFLSNKLFLQKYTLTPCVN